MAMIVIDEVEATKSQPSIRDQWVQDVAKLAAAGHRVRLTLFGIQGEVIGYYPPRPFINQPN